MAGDDPEQRVPDLENLADDNVKLVAYTIVSLKRDHEHVMDGGSDSVIVTDSMSGEAFVSWILAKYLQQEVLVPCKDKKQRRSELIPSGDLKYLRVYFVVSKRWPRQSLAFESREVRTLREIRDALSERAPKA
jgi:hypothetical protein